MDSLGAANFGMTGYSLLAVYMLFMVGCGVYFARKQRALSDYFLGGRSIPAWAVLLAVVATETSSVTFVGTPTQSFWGDCSFLQLVFGYCVARVILAFRFIPAFCSGELFTIYQHLGATFGPGIQRLAGVLFFVTKALAAGVRHWCAALVLKLVTGWDPVVSVIVMGLISVIYTVSGGLSAVVWTEVVQMIIMILGALVALWVMVTSVPNLGDAIAYATEAGRFHIFDFGNPFASSGYNLWNGLIGGTFLSLASHGADQDLVQRLLACKSLRGAKGAMIGSGILVLAQFALFLFIGALLFVFYAGQFDRVIVQPNPDSAPLAEVHYEPSAVHPDTAEGTLVLQNNDDVFPLFIIRYLSPLVAAFVIAAIFAAAMSSTSSALNSLASTTMNDFIKPLRRSNPSEKEVLLLSRFLTVGWCIVIMAIALMSQSESILETALAVASFTFGSLLGAFLLAVFTPFRNAPGTAAGMLLGVVVAIFLAFVLIDPATKAPIINWTWRIPIASLITVAGGAIGSFLFPGPPEPMQAES